MNPVTSFSGTAHRQTGLDTPAFPPGRPAPTHGRYHRPGEPWPLYASLEPATAWAEWKASTNGAIDPADERRRLWRIDVRDLAVIDLRRPGLADELGISERQLTGPRSRAHGLAARARELGAEALIVPSAARADAWNLVVFPSGFGRLRAAGSRAMHPRPPA
ncbi:MAG TPA: RES family NAD+ phosphorylase [Candidatus Limnocylindria bacterium]|nr:RES family NAD+ phosphorylase [Candidatus Limnocylindria bacterium]